MAFAYAFTFTTPLLHGFRFALGFGLIGLTIALHLAVHNPTGEMRRPWNIALRCNSFIQLGIGFSMFLTARYESTVGISNIPFYQLIMPAAVAVYVYIFFRTFFSARCGNGTLSILNAAHLAAMALFLFEFGDPKSNGFTSPFGWLSMINVYFTVTILIIFMFVNMARWYTLRSLAFGAMLFGAYNAVVVTVVYLWSSKPTPPDGPRGYVESAVPTVLIAALFTCQLAVVLRTWTWIARLWRARGSGRRSLEKLQLCFIIPSVIANLLVVSAPIALFVYGPLIRAMEGPDGVQSIDSGQHLDRLKDAQKRKNSAITLAVTALFIYFLFFAYYDMSWGARWVYKVGQRSLPFFSITMNALVWAFLAACAANAVGRIAYGRDGDHA